MKRDSSTSRPDGNREDTISASKGSGRFAQNDNLFGRFGMSFHTQEAAGADKNGPRAPDDFFFCHTPAPRASGPPWATKANSRFLVVRPLSAHQARVGRAPRNDT